MKTARASLGVTRPPEGAVGHEKQQCGRARQRTDAQVPHSQRRHRGRRVEPPDQRGGAAPKEGRQPRADHSRYPQIVNRRRGRLCTTL